MLPNLVGPDGVALKRNSSDFKRFLFINAMVRSFTSCEESIAQRNQDQRKLEEQMMSQFEHKKLIEKTSGNASKKH